MTIERDELYELMYEAARQALIDREGRPEAPMSKQRHGRRFDWWLSRG